VEKLKDSELRYRRLFEAAQDGILILDAETGMIEDVNPFLIKMLGYSRLEQKTGGWFKLNSSATSIWWTTKK
jgi:PAS domain S-box-containing protein